VTLQIVYNEATSHATVGAPPYAWVVRNGMERNMPIACPTRTEARAWSRLGAAVSAMTIAALAGCVDLTPPWDKVTVQSGAGGSGGAEADGPMSSGGSLDTGAGGVVDVGGVAGADGGSPSGIDAPPSGMGGAIDTAIGATGGVLGTGGSILDVANADTGPALGGAAGNPDVPLAGTGGGPGSGGASVTGGISGSGGRRGSGGTRGSGGIVGAGGTTGTGGTRGSGGTTGSGGSTGSGGTAGPEAGPDLGPDTASPADALNLLAGLVAYYPCDGAEIDGITLPDMSGNWNDGTLMAAALPDGGAPPAGGYGFGTGVVDNAVVLSAAGRGFVNLPPSVFAGATDITIATWVKITTAITWEKLIDVGIDAHRTTATTSGGIYMCMAPTTSGKTFAIATNGIQEEQDLAAPSTLGTSNGWTHLAVVLGSSSEILYVNGAAVTTTTSVTLRPKDLGAIDYAFIGRSQFTSDTTFDGTVDEFRVYNRALSAAEVQALYLFRGP
jgi:hypothetical protein